MLQEIEYEGATAWKVHIRGSNDDVMIVRRGKGFNLLINGMQMSVGNTFEPNSPHWPTYGQFEKCVEMIRGKYLFPIGRWLKQINDEFNAQIVEFNDLDAKDRVERQYSNTP